MHREYYRIVGCLVKVTEGMIIAKVTEEMVIDFYSWFQPFDFTLNVLHENVTDLSFQINC